MDRVRTASTKSRVVVRTVQAKFRGLAVTEYKKSNATQGKSLVGCLSHHRLLVPVLKSVMLKQNTPLQAVP